MLIERADVQIALQALSSLAIAGGLLFTAVQFRQARKAQVVANFEKLVEMQFQLRQLRVQNPALARVHSSDVEHLHSDEEIQEYFLNLMQVSLFEIAWYAHREGQLPSDYFKSWASRMTELGKEESFQRMMANPAMKIMHDDFAAYLRTLVNLPDTPSRARTTK